MAHKVVFNGCYGGFCLSKKAIKWLDEHGIKDCYELERHNPLLVKCVETLGLEASERFSDLCIAEIKGNKYKITEYDGMETVIEPEDENWIEICD